MHTSNGINHIFAGLGYLIITYNSANVLTKFQCRIRYEHCKNLLMKVRLTCKGTLAQEQDKDTYAVATVQF